MSKLFKDIFCPCDEEHLFFLDKKRNKSPEDLKELKYLKARKKAIEAYLESLNPPKEEK